MSATKLKVKRTTVSSVNTGQVDMVMLLGVVYLVMAVLQLISFSYFKDWFTVVGFGNAAAWAAAIIILEVVAALGFIKLALPPVARKISWWAAILVSGFWFIQNIRMVSDALTSQLSNSGFFGKYLSQSPSWWTVLEAFILLLWTLHALSETEKN